MLAPLPPIPGLPLPPCAPDTEIVQLPVVETIHGTIVPVQEKDVTTVGGPVGAKVTGDDEVGLPEGAEVVGVPEGADVTGANVEGLVVGVDVVGSLVGVKVVGE